MSSTSTRKDSGAETEAVVVPTASRDGAGLDVLVRF